MIAPYDHFIAFRITTENANARLRQEQVVEGATQIPGNNYNYTWLERAILTTVRKVWCCE